MLIEGINFAAFTVVLMLIVCLDELINLRFSGALRTIVDQCKCCSVQDKHDQMLIEGINFAVHTVFLTLIVCLDGLIHVRL